ncbi:DUF4388 domain-containing protein [Hyalangium versicolor]|uniref:DUF4388 domain-containing protein n=1 Tax=Hyalangium versicolor TaxID=2861190 RepID=UPI001CCB8932|nr:DUF4388 domain-containing protein [Hyalangium versicolor]
MFPAPSHVLRQREGTLAEMPLPLLLHALAMEERTCTLELRARQREKRITFEEGAPVACVSNLLHETLGKFLVEKGKLSEADYQKTLSESIQTGQDIGALLVQKALISPFDLYKQLQANLGLSLLDCFRWTDARYKLIADVDPPGTSVRTNTAQLILTGVANMMPFDVVATHFTFTDDRRFAQVPGVDGPKLSAKDARLFQSLRMRPTFSELLERTGYDTEAALRRLYALCIVGIVDFADAVDERVASAPVPPAATVLEPEPVTPAVPSGTPFSDEDEAARNELVSVFMSHRSQDPFGLLGVPEDVQPLALRKAFLSMADKFSPLRFNTPDLKEKAEILLAAYARAFGVLMEPDLATLWRKRRAAAREKEKGTGRPTTAEQFRIKTELLDGRTQFDQGKKRLETRNFTGALEYFEYACDIEPRPMHLAYRAWARYLIKPEAHGKLAQQELSEVLRQDPGLEEGWFFFGEVCRGESQWSQAEDAYRRAFKLNPKNRRYVDLIQETIKNAKR